MFAVKSGPVWCQGLHLFFSCGREDEGETGDSYKLRGGTNGHQEDGGGGEGRDKTFVALLVLLLMEL